MASDGEILRAYLDLKDINKVQFAKDLKMSQQNLYQLFRSKNFTPATVKKVEGVLGTTWKHIESTNIGTTKPLYIEEPESDYKSKYISLLEKQVMDGQMFLNQAKENRQKIEELTRRLDILTNSVLAVAAQNTGYQAYWAEHFPPKGVSPDQVKQGVRKKSREALAVFLKDGIVV